MLWTQTNTGAVIQNWITPTSIIPGNAYMWTWGVEGTPAQEPDLWHFHVFFVSNDTAEVLLIWNLNQSTLFDRNSSKIDETFDVQLPRTNQPWRWDWLIRNPNNRFLLVENFTVTHYPLRYPERQNGAIAMGVGALLIITSIAAFVFFRHRRSQRQSQSPFQPSEVTVA